MPKLSAVLNDSAYQSADESLKTFYVQNTETKVWWLDVDEPGKLDVAGAQSLQNKKDELKRVHGEKTAAERELTAYRALGAVEEIKEKLEANRPEEISKLIEKYETEKTQLRQSFEEPLESAKARAAKLEAQVQNALIQSEIAKLRDTYGLNDAANFTLKEYIKVVPKEEGSDEFVVKVFENGQEALVAGQPQTPDQLIKGFQEQKKYPWMFNVGDGAGTGNTNRTTNSGLNKQLEGLPAVERLKVARQNGATT